jgi:hypothetical protein
MGDGLGIPSHAYVNYKHMRGFGVGSEEVPLDCSNYLWTLLVLINYAGMTPAFL